MKVLTGLKPNEREYSGSSGRIFPGTGAGTDQTVDEGSAGKWNKISKGLGGTAVCSETDERSGRRKPAVRKQMEISAEQVREARIAYESAKAEFQSYSFSSDFESEEAAKKQRQKLPVKGTFTEDYNTARAAREKAGTERSNTETLIKNIGLSFLQQKQKKKSGKELREYGRRKRDGRISMEISDRYL